MNYDRLTETFESLPFMEAAARIRTRRFHDHNLQTHTIKTAEHLILCEQTADLVAAAYLHDIGKLVLATPHGDGTYSIGKGHAALGQQIILSMKPEFFKQYGLDQKVIAELVSRHDEPLRLAISLRRDISFEEFSAKLGEYTTMLNSDPLGAEVIELFWADTIAKGNCPDRAELSKYYSFFKRKNTSEQDVYESRYMPNTP